jgi:hypothetical protein
MFSFGAKFCQEEKLFLGLQVATLTKAVFGNSFHKNKGFGLVCQIFKTCSYMRLLNSSRITIFLLFKISCCHLLLNASWDISHYATLEN